MARLNVTVTDPQHKTIKAAEPRIGAYIRRLIAEDMARRGIAWPDAEQPKWGDAERLTRKVDKLDDTA